jgi:pimeloyl-ACP methyl ester carboxylesterase
VLPATLLMGVLPIPVGLGIIMRNFEDGVKTEARRLEAGRVAAFLVLAAALALVSPRAAASQSPAGPNGDVALDVPVPGAVLAGALRLPAGARRPPVVVLVAGSGPTDRDGNSAMGPRPSTLRQLADSLEVAGIASYRFDKRGIGRSAVAGLREETMRFETFADDIAAIVRALSADGRTGRAVIAGHSEGALLGLLATQRVPVAGYVSIAGVARPAHVVLHDQLAPQLPPALLAQADSALAQLAAGRQPVASPAGLEMLFRPSVQPYLVSWFRYSGEAEIRRLVGPCLIIQGAHDIQVPVAEADRLAAAQPRCERLTVPGMNHVLKTAPAERAAQGPSYSDPTLPLTSGVAARLAAFVRANAAR